MSWERVKEKYASCELCKVVEEFKRIDIDASCTSHFIQFHIEDEVSLPNDLDYEKR